jgi:hypothetical protein
MANWTILFSLEGLFMVERRDMNNNPMIPIKTFDIVFLLFSKSILGSVVFDPIRKSWKGESGQSSILGRKRVYPREFLLALL